MTTAPRPRILALAGSLRRGSFNKMLVKIAATGAEQAGADVTFLDLKDYPLPVFDEDLESADGPPESALALKEIFRGHDGLLVASPEYNSSISAALKNTIDWISRPEEAREPMDCFTGKVAAIMSAAAGGLGGMRALPHLRAILQNINVIVLPTMISIPAAYEAFTEDGSLQDDRKHAQVQALGTTLAHTTAKLLA